MFTSKGETREGIRDLIIFLDRISSLCLVHF